MSEIILGKTVDQNSSAGARWRNVGISLNILLRSHLLIWASTGGGKTWLIRRLVEQAFGKVPIILIDSEGEFASLREKFGFVLVGQDGETPADVRSAKIVAEKLMELKASAVCDIFELKHEARHEWVKAFVNGLTEAPKRLWRPRIIIIDEAHRFCPEKGQGESVAYGAVADLAGVGRKRGLGIVLATQRLSKLSKNATGEMYNQAAGPTARQADRDRAAYEMGITGRIDVQKFSDQLRKMERGTFFFQGRAVSMDSILVKVGPVQTTHPDPGSMKYRSGPPPPPKKIRALLPKLADLPKQAVEKAQTIEEFRKEIRALQSQLRAAPKIAGIASDSKTNHNALVAAKKSNNVLGVLLEAAMKLLRKVNAIGFEDAAIKPGEVRELLEATAKEVAKLASKKIAQRAREFDYLKKEGNRLLSQLKKALSQKEISVKIDVERTKPYSIQLPLTRGRTVPGLDAGMDGVSAQQKKILAALADFDAIGRALIPRTWIAARAGVKPRSSAFANNLRALRSAAMIDYGPNKTVCFTNQGRSSTPAADTPLTTAGVLESCLKIISHPQRNILSVLHQRGTVVVGREDVAHAAGVSPTSSAFANNLRALRSIGMIEYGPDKTVKCSEWLFLEL